MPQFNITVQPTTNENIVKFVANSFLTQSISYEFKNIDEANSSPLAQQLFYLPFVKTIYISQNFIAIEKYNIVSWTDVQDEVASSITDYLSSGKQVIEDIDTTKKIPITIYAESTPNPSVMKFVANKPLVHGIFEFKNIDEAVHAPLAKELFSFPFIKEVFISANYVSVMKYDVAEWVDISLEVREFIRNYIEKGKVILSDEILSKDPEISSVESSEVSAKSNTNNSDIDNEIIAILEEYVKPAVASDGNNIKIRKQF